MGNEPTHALTITVGLDLTKILSPASVAGVMAYLGVDQESGLLEAVAIDQNKRAAEALEKQGFTILSSEFKSLVKPQEKHDQEHVESATNSSTEGTQILNSEVASAVGDVPAKLPQANEQVNYLMDNLMNAFQKIRMGEGEIIEVVIDKTLEDKMPDAKSIRTVTVLSEEASIVYGDVDEGELAMISYVDKDNELEFKSIKEEMNG